MQEPGREAGVYVKKEIFTCKGILEEVKLLTDVRFFWFVLDIGTEVSSLIPVWVHDENFSLMTRVSSKKIFDNEMVHFVTF